MQRFFFFFLLRGRMRLLVLFVYCRYSRYKGRHSLTRVSGRSQSRSSPQFKNNLLNYKPSQPISRNSTKTSRNRRASWKRRTARWDASCSWSSRLLLKNKIVKSDVFNMCADNRAVKGGVPTERGPGGSLASSRNHLFLLINPSW